MEAEEYEMTAQEPIETKVEVGDNGISDSDSVSAAVADEIRAASKLPPLSDEEKQRRQIEREIWREEQAWQAEQRRVDRERAEAKRRRRPTDKRLLPQPKPATRPIGKCESALNVTLANVR